MSTYKVTLPFVIYVTAEIEADSEQEAIDNAINEVGLTTYCGGGGSDRLCGSWDMSHTIECGDFIEGDNVADASAELIDGDENDQA